MKKLLDSGTDAGRLNVILVAEGYRAADLPQFERHAAELARAIEREPWFFPGCLNVHALEAESKEPGFWLVPHKGLRSTAFSAQFGGAGRVARLITGDTETVARYVADEVFAPGVKPFPYTIGVLVNSRLPGGRGIEAVKQFWSATGPGWTAQALHELGHSAFGLRDEYSDDTGQKRSWPADWPEPEQPNVTTDPIGLKWQHLTADVFEGAARYDVGIYRPAKDCRMRTLLMPFCVVCQDAIRRKLESYMEELPEDTAPGGHGQNGEILVQYATEGRWFKDDSAGAFGAQQWILRKQFVPNER
jgi:hypothetical protein